MIHLRAAATLADQLASSASNTLIVLALAQVASVGTFGRVALYLAILTVALAVVRGAFGTLLLLSSARSPRSTTLECSLGSTAALIVYVPVALCLLVVGAIQGDLILVVIAVLAGPPLLLQDLQRHAVLARGRTFLALFWDGVWVAGSVALLVLAWRGTVQAPEHLLGWWAVLAVISYLGLLAGTRAVPRVRLLIPWLRRHLRLRSHYAAEASLGALMTATLFTATTALVGEQTTAALRGASTLFGPLSVAMSSLPLLLLPEMARKRADLSVAWRAARPVSWALTVSALALAGLMLALPDQVGELLLGGVWAVTRPIIGFTGAEYAAVVWLSAAFTCWRSARMGQVVFRARAAYSLTTVVLAVGAAALFQETAKVALAMTTSAMVVTAIVILLMNRGTTIGLMSDGNRQLVALRAGQKMTRDGA